jgi:transposase
VRLQRDSELTKWYLSRFGTGSSRSRRIGIVALARKLLVALWRYVQFGVIPAGARFKPAEA